MTDTGKRTYAQLERENENLRHDLNRAYDDFNEMRRNMAESHAHRMAALEEQYRRLMEHLSRIEGVRLPVPMIIAPEWWPK